MLSLLIALPLLAGLAALLMRANRLRRGLLVGAAASHLLLVLAAWVVPVAPLSSGWLALDAPGKLFLTITSVLFLAASVQAIGYLGDEAGAQGAETTRTGFAFNKVPEAVFTGCMLLFLATMTLVTVCQHLGLLWVAVEATTLASAPLIFFHRDARSLEATWKYLVVCSVGIALALLGNFFLAVAATGRTGPVPGMLLSELAAAGPGLHPAWVKAALIFFLVGYGTKMGLAPMHTWLPDAHSEAPALVSSLLSGAVLNCAFLAILRVMPIAEAAGAGAFSRDLLVLLGLVSMGTAAIFVIGQVDYKRMLAYSSVEHMGILSVGVGLGGAAVGGAMFHAVNHSLVKAMLFLVAGNILSAYATKRSSSVRGMLASQPATGVLWLAGLLAVSGMPPFGTFLSELTIIKAAVDQGRYFVTGLFLLLIAIVFIGMTTSILPMAQGRGNAAAVATPWTRSLPAAVLGVLALALGLHIPAALLEALRSAATAFGGF
jgi:hydrogenase-4 component F